jgi:hypothetical protein
MATTHYRPSDAAEGTTSSRFVSLCGRDVHRLDGTDRPEYVECQHCRRALAMAPAVREAPRGGALVAELIAALGGES